VARPYVKSIKTQEAKDIFGRLSQSNQYQVTFSGLPEKVVKNIESKTGIRNVFDYMSRKGSLLCSEASLPSSSLATTEIKNDFIGIPQEFAHTRLYTDIDFSFYIDYDYKNLRIFEGWIDYIAGGSESIDNMKEENGNYYRRMRYPDDYKTQTMFISKFERDNGPQLDYQFFNAFPKLITSIPLSYGGASILKVNVSFNYDRYIINPKTTNNQNKKNTSSLTFREFDPNRPPDAPILPPPGAVPGTKVETPKAPTPQKEPKGAAREGVLGGIREASSIDRQLNNTTATQRAIENLLNGF